MWPSFLRYPQGVTRCARRHGDLAATFARRPCHLLRSSSGLGAPTSSAACALLYNSVGRRGLPIFGVLTALLLSYVRRNVREPNVPVENRAIQRTQQRVGWAPLLTSFECSRLLNTLNDGLVDHKRLRRRLLDQDGFCRLARGNHTGSVSRA